MYLFGWVNQRGPKKKLELVLYKQLLKIVKTQNLCETKLVLV